MEKSFGWGRQKGATITLLNKTKLGNFSPMSAMLATSTQIQLFDCLCAVDPFTVDRLSDGGLFRNGVMFLVWKDSLCAKIVLSFVLLLLIHA